MTILETTTRQHRDAPTPSVDTSQRERPVPADPTHTARHVPERHSPDPSLETDRYRLATPLNQRL